MKVIFDGMVAISDEEYELLQSYKKNQNKIPAHKIVEVIGELKENSMSNDEVIKFAHSLYPDRKDMRQAYMHSRSFTNKKYREVAAMLEELLND